VRATGLTCGSDLLEAHGSLDAAVRVRSPFLLVHTAAPSRTGFGAGYDSAFKVLDAGALTMWPSTGQELLDFSLIGRRASELAITPVLLAQDVAADASIVGTLRLPLSEEVREYLGLEDDQVDSPTPAQRMLFGDRRRRVVRLLDLAHPLAVGVPRNEDWEHRAGAGDRPFFERHLPDLVDQAMAEFALVTGRHYERAATYQVERSDLTVITFGAAGELVRRARATLGKSHRSAVGHVHLNVLTPFPSDTITRALTGKQRVLVIERSTGGASDGPLSSLVRDALHRAVENGLADAGSVPHPDCAAWPRGAQMPAVTSAVLSASESADVEEMVDILRAAADDANGEARSRRFFVGVSPGETSSRLPVLEQLRQRIQRAYPGLASYASPRLSSGQFQARSSRVRILASNPEDAARTGTTLAVGLGSLERCLVGTRWSSGSGRRPAYVVEYAHDSTRDAVSDITAVLDDRILAGADVIEHIGEKSIVLVAGSAGTVPDPASIFSNELLSAVRKRATKVLSFAVGKEGIGSLGRSVVDHDVWARALVAAIEVFSDADRSAVLAAISASEDDGEPASPLTLTDVDVPQPTDKDTGPLTEPEPPYLVR
jgi:hypothetical protein